MSTITKQEVIDAQTKWGNTIVEIGNAFTNKEDYVALASQRIDELYSFQDGEVLFKPTKAAEKQFRPTKEDAISYFVASNNLHQEDSGFAITPWTNVEFQNSVIKITQDTALAMGNYFFTDTSGGKTKVEYTFGYVKDDNNNLRIILHHSSVPYQN